MCNEIVNHCLVLLLDQLNSFSGEPSIRVEAQLVMWHCTSSVFFISIFLQLDQSFSEYGRQYSSFVVVSVVEIDVNLHSRRNTEQR